MSGLRSSGHYFLRFLKLKVYSYFNVFPKELPSTPNVLRKQPNLRELKTHYFFLLSPIRFLYYYYTLPRKRQLKCRMKKSVRAIQMIEQTQFLIFHKTRKKNKFFLNVPSQKLVLYCNLRATKAKSQINKQPKTLSKQLEVVNRQPKTANQKMQVPN